MSSKFQIKGTGDLSLRLRSKAVDVSKAATESIKKSLEQMKTELKETIPVNTGRLLRSMRTKLVRKSGKINGKITVGSTNRSAKYARFAHEIPDRGGRTGRAAPRPLIVGKHRPMATTKSYTHGWRFNQKWAHKIANYTGKNPYWRKRKSTESQFFLINALANVQKSFMRNLKNAIKQKIHAQ